MILFPYSNLNVGRIYWYSGKVFYIHFKLEEYFMLPIQYNPVHWPAQSTTDENSPRCSLCPPQLFLLFFILSGTFKPHCLLFSGNIYYLYSYKDNPPIFLSVIFLESNP